MDDLTTVIGTICLALGLIISAVVLLTPGVQAVGAILAGLFLGIAGAAFVAHYFFGDEFGK